MILRAAEWHHRFAIGDGEKARFLSLHEGLDHDFLPCRAKAAGKHIGDGLPCLVRRLDDDDALARGQPIGLYDHRQIEIIEGGQRIGLPIAAHIGSGRDIGAVAQRLGKGFRSLELCGGPRRAEHRNILSPQAVGQPIDQGRFRADHHQGDIFAPAKGDHRVMIASIQRHAGRAFGNAGIARRREQFAKAWALCQFPGQRMFAPPSAQQQDIHGDTPPDG